MSIILKVESICGESIINAPVTLQNVKNFVSVEYGVSDFYLLKNGKLLSHDIVQDGVVYVVPRVFGGKGGFGSMLRAIGAQIEKTTNREACRDLSGRRLRDINEEKRLKNWIAQQAEREREAAERRRKKLERLCVEPKHDFNDQDYEKDRSELIDRVHDAVEQGFRTSASTSTSTKRRQETIDNRKSKEPQKKKHCLWIDVEEEDISSVDSDDSDIEDTKLEKGSSKKDHSQEHGTSQENVSTLIKQEQPEDSTVDKNETEDINVSCENSKCSEKEVKYETVATA